MSSGSYIARRRKRIARLADAARGSRSRATFYSRQRAVAFSLALGVRIAAPAIGQLVAQTSAALRAFGATVGALIIEVKRKE